MNLWPVEHFFEGICHHFWVGLLLLVEQQTHPKVMASMLKKVFNWSEVHLSEITSYKIHNLTPNTQIMFHKQRIFPTFDGRCFWLLLFGKHKSMVVA